MYNTVIIDTLAKAMDLIMDNTYDNSINRFRSPYVYRGLSNSNHNLATSLQRNCKDKLELEKSILRNFAKYASMEVPEHTTSIWRQMILGQHHGLPTRLMDWTCSPLVGLHFALDNTLDVLDIFDSIVWKVNLYEMNSMLPDKYQQKLEEHSACLMTIDMLEDIGCDLKKYDDDMGETSILFIEPPSIDSRIINQYSYFSVIPSGIGDIEKFLNTNANDITKYIIRKDIKWLLRDKLDQLNINERILFPGLDGLATWLKRHYFVRADDKR